MKKILVGVFAALLCASSFAITPSPVSLLNTAGSTAGQAILSSGPTSTAAWTSIVDSVIAGSGVAVSGATGNVTVSVATNGVAVGQLAQQAANTVLANATSSTANVAAFSMPSCSSTVSALNWTSGTGFTCNTGLITASTVSSTYLAAAIAASTYAPLATSGQPYFQATLSANQSVTVGTFTKIQFNTKVFDSNTYYDATTNYRFTPLKAGKYLVTVSLIGQSTATATANNGAIAAIYKNGARVASDRASLYAPATVTVNPAAAVTYIVSMNGSTDYIEAWGEVDGASAGLFLTSDTSYFEANYIGP